MPEKKFQEKASVVTLPRQIPSGIVWISAKVATVSSFLIVLSYLSESCLVRGKRDGTNKVPGLVGGKSTSKRQVPCLDDQMSFTVFLSRVCAYGDTPRAKVVTGHHQLVERWRF